MSGETIMFSDVYVVLFHVDDYEGIDFEAANRYLVEINAPYPVWIFKKVKSIAELSFLNPAVRQFISVNIDDAAVEFAKAKHPDILFVNRVAKITNIEPVKSNEYPYAPWGDLK